MVNQATADYSGNFAGVVGMPAGACLVEAVGRYLRAWETPGWSASPM